jgi:hypothetical protein
MFTERVSVEDFESQHFQSQLVERLGWAVGDAAAVERDPAAEPYADDASGDWEEQPREDAGEVRERAERERAERQASPEHRARLSAAVPVS